MTVREKQAPRPHIARNVTGQREVIFTFKVRGIVNPASPTQTGLNGLLDMMRYDCAWPATSADVATIHRGSNEPIEFEMRSINDPTVKRWNSFGFEVL